MKTINCAECNVEFTFEENPKYPRKYCMNCSNVKKQQWKQQGDTAKDVEIVKIVEGAMAHSKKWDDHVHKVLTEKPKTNGFKLTDENIRIGALTCAIELRKLEGGNHIEIWKVVKEFEEYIRNGK